MVSSIYTPNKRIDYYRNLSRALMPKQIRAYNPNIRNRYAQTASTNLANVLSGLVQTYSAEQQLGKAEQLEAEQLAAQQAIGGRLAQFGRPGTGSTLDVRDLTVPPSQGFRQQQVRRRPFSVDAPQFTPEQIAAAGTTPELLQGRIAEITAGRKEAYTARQKEELERGLTRALTAGDDDLVSQYEKILYPEEVLKRRAAQRKTGEERKYAAGITAEERAYQEGLTETQRTQHLADRAEDRAWTVEDTAARRTEAAERRLQSIDDQLKIARQQRRWRVAEALERRKEKIWDDVQAEGRKLIYAYDFTAKKNVILTRSEYDKNAGNYGTKRSDVAPSKEWVTVTNKQGESRSTKLTDVEIIKLQKEGMQVQKTYSETRRFKDLGVYVLKGKVIGEGFFDKKSANRFIRRIIDGKPVDTPIPEGAEPRTEGSLSLHIPGGNAFRKLRGQLISDETELRSYARYMKNIGGTSIGWRRLADDLFANYKTFVAENVKKLGLTPGEVFEEMSKHIGLTDKEVAVRVARGELQGLVGKARISTVGGGVMTEKDAWRVITNLGGDVDSLQNPTVVRAQISRLYNDKARDYRNTLEDYNIAINERYGAAGYKVRPDFTGTVDPKLFLPSVSLGPAADVSQFSKMSKTDLLAIDRESLSTPDLVLWLQALKAFK